MNNRHIRLNRILMSLADPRITVWQHIVRREGLGVPQSARDVFDLMARGGWIDVSLAEALKRMVAFRNIAVHDYQSLILPILVNVITGHLDEFLTFTHTVLKRG